MTIEVQQSAQSHGGLLKPALLYFSLAFAVGFALGPVRMFVIAPRVGPVAAVLIEAPFILLASLFIARWVLRRFAVQASVIQRFKIGILAFGMMMAAELLMSLSLGIGPRAFVVSLATPEGSIGLVGQSIFAFIPIFIRPR